MNRTSRFLAGALACTAALSVLAGCSSKQTEQYDRYNYDLSQYVQLCEYKGLEIEEADRLRTIWRIRSFWRAPITRRSWRKRTLLR